MLLPVDFSRQIEDSAGQCETAAPRRSLEIEKQYKSSGFIIFKIQIFHYQE